MKPDGPSDEEACSIHPLTYVCMLSQGCMKSDKTTFNSMQQDDNCLPPQGSLTSLHTHLQCCREKSMSVSSSLCIKPAAALHSLLAGQESCRNCLSASTYMQPRGNCTG